MAERRSEDHGAQGAEFEINERTRIYLAGHRGLVGEALYRYLKDHGYKNVITATSAELDLCSQQQTTDFFKRTRPEVLIIAAAKVGGIGANSSKPAEFIYRNLMIGNNAIHQAYVHNVKRLLFLGSSCIYPRENRQPMQESDLLSGPLEPTNEPYAIAKIAGLRMCAAYRKQYQCDYRVLMPCNLYGRNDNFNLEDSHVLPAMIHKFYLAQQQDLPEVHFWGSGNVRREFLHADDLADACLKTLQISYERYDQVCAESSHINVGSGEDVKLRDLVSELAKIYQYNGKIMWNRDKPDGTKRKLLDVSKMNALGWKPAISLSEGLRATVTHYQSARAQLRH
jgi:GDP-L-fucose synthase